MTGPVDDFRRRTAHLRRRRTGRRLVQALLEQADRTRLPDIVVADVLDAAGMARGSFYRHFATMDLLLDHVGAAVGAQINSEMTSLLDDCADPARRIGLRVRYQVRRATTDPACAALLLRLLGREGTVGDFAARRATADFQDAVDQGRFTVPGVGIATDLGHGMLTAILRRAVLDGHDEALVREQVQVLLQAFGVAPADARRCAAVPLPDPPEPSLREAVLILCDEQTP